MRMPSYRPNLKPYGLPPTAIFADVFLENSETLLKCDIFYSPTSTVITVIDKLTIGLSTGRRTFVRSDATDVGSVETIAIK